MESLYIRPSRIRVGSTSVVGADAPAPTLAGNTYTNTSSTGDTLDSIGNSFNFFTGLAVGVAGTFIFMTMQATKVAHSYSPRFASGSGGRIGGSSSILARRSNDD
jgi:hypothetical protein